MKDIIRFHVPCKLEYTKLVEDVSDLISSYLNLKNNEQFASKLRAVMNEVFINIVEHSDTAAQNERTVGQQRRQGMGKCLKQAMWHLQKCSSQILLK